MSGSGQKLETKTLEGRFDEKTQRDVLALAARLQREHFDTMSAAEIERAAVEGGLSVEFVQEAIRRIAKSPSSTIHEDARQETTKSEWAVAISVPLFVVGILLLRYVLRGHHPIGLLLLGFIGFLIFSAFLVFAILGVRATFFPRADFNLPKIDAYKISKRSGELPIGSLVTHGLLALSLVALPFSDTFQQWPNLFFSYFMILITGYFSSSPRHSFWKGVGFGAVAAVACYWLRSLHGVPFSVSDSPIVLAFSGLFGGILSLIGQGVRRIFSRKEPVAPTLDRTEMLAQLFELQAALDRHQQRRTFLSVDVVASSSMKTTGEELEAEYSFRQYQTWVANTARAYEGEVQIAAGDGVMAMFPDASQAILAAKQLQNGIGDFNSLHNRLQTPFRIRCGIAEGKIGLDAKTPLGEIQSPVVDRAAFLQKYADPGAVVVTKDLIEAAMPILGSLHQKEMIDGKAVYAWP